MGRRHMKKDLIRILIIEDNADHVALLSEMIERNFAPVDIHTVESIDDAIDFIEQTEYDLVFADCYIGNADIINQIPHLKSKLDNIPIILITGSGDEDMAAEVIKKGASEYLVKSKTSLEKIPLLINKYLKLRSGEPPKKEKPPQPATIPDQIMDEVSVLNKRAQNIAGKSGQIPDISQIESLLGQIQRLKNLASKLTKK
jgi:DNA-binding NtrC family response regulator